MRGSPSAWRRLLPFACLYVSFGATLGFLGGGAPIILRERGVALAEVGLLQLIYLPLGLSFLWSALIDKVHLPFLSHRVAWIVAMQLCSIGLLAVLLTGERWSVTSLFATAVAISFSSTTMDVALEALVVDTVSPPSRPAVTTAKLAGASVGGMIGTGLLAMVYDRLGWQGSFAVIVSLNTLCLLPILAYPENRLRTVATVGREARSGPARHLAKHVGVIGFYFAANALLLNSTSLVLVDLRMPLAAVGFTVGTLGPAINLTVILFSGAAMAKVSAWRVFIAAASGVTISGVLFVLATVFDSIELGVMAVILSAIAASALSVPVFSLLYTWAQGASAATNYSVLFGIGFLMALPARVAGPALAQALGWPIFFALATTIYVISLGTLGSSLRQTKQRDCESPDLSA